MGAIDFVTEAVVVATWWLESVSLIEPVAAARPVVLVVDHPNVDLVVEADAIGSVKYSLNLLSNAIKFSPPASTVTVTTRQHDARAESKSGRGSGIDPSLAEPPLCPFDRLDARERGFAGVGSRAVSAAT